MPIYIFSHPETGEIKEIYQKMTDEHVYEENGVVWNREFTSPTAGIDTEIDPMSSRDFVEKTGKKKGSLGDIWDASKEASLKREKKIGKDPLKEKYWSNWSKERNGRKPPPGAYT